MTILNNAESETLESPEPRLRLNDVPKLPWLPKRRAGSRLAIATVHRWCTDGVRGCRLRFECVGGTRCTTQSWLREFFYSLAQLDSPNPSVQEVETKAQRERRANAAAERLQSEGFVIHQDQLSQSVSEKPVLLRKGGSHA